MKVGSCRGIPGKSGSSLKGGGWLGRAGGRRLWAAERRHGIVNHALDRAHREGIVNRSGT
jgi:hypothetical protein